MINETVRPFFNSEILSEACVRFDIPPANAKLVQGNSNLIFDCGTRFLRLSHSAIRGTDEIVPEITWLLDLLEEQFPVVRPLMSRHGRYCEQIGEEEHFTAVCFETINGRKIKRNEWGASHFVRLGKLVGQMHRAGRKFEQSSHAVYPDWDELEEYDNHPYLSSVDAAYEGLHKLLIKHFATFPKTSTNYGLVHYDVHHGNYLLAEESGELVFFDFELACKSWYANDVAIVLYYAGHFEGKFKTPDFEATFMKHFWVGYEGEFHIKKEEKEWIPFFLLYRDLFVLSFVARIWDLEKLTKLQAGYIKFIKKSVSERSRILGYS